MRFNFVPVRLTTTKLMKLLLLLLMMMMMMMMLACACVYTDYTDHQFSGVIRRLRVNGRPVQMSGGRTENKVEVWHCSAEEVNRFITFLKQQQRYVHN